MSVHYKFKAALEFSTVTFDGIHISVLDLKNAIIDQKKLAKNADSDLQIMNAQTKEVYDDDTTLIPKNTSVIVARVPLAEKRRNGGGGPGNAGGGGPPHLRHQNRPPAPSTLPSAVTKGVDLTAMEGTEEEKIQAMMAQASADYDPSTYAKIRGANQHGRVPDRYRCYKCNQAGHWIKDCPLPGGGSGSFGDEVKKSTGIPRSFMVVVDGPQVPGALITPEGRYAVPAVDHAAYMERNKPAMAEPPTPKPKIPEELLCNLCQDLLTDALLVPCCANSYCDDCIRSALLESENQECPGCHEKEISPTSLIPNRFLRTAVAAFKNETGYSKPQKIVEPVRQAPPTVDLTLPTPTDDTRKLSLDELPDDLFPHSPRKTDGADSDKSEHTKGNDGDQNDKTDLYDFNDGSIPSPLLSSSEKEKAVPDFKNNERSIRSIAHSQSAGRGNFQRTRTPLHSEMPPIPTGHPHRGEPPPPGFEDYPPGEDRGSPRRDDRIHRNPPPDDMQGHRNGPHLHNRSLLSMPLPFNPNQPPPGFYPGMGPGPPMFGGIPPGGPGSGPMHPNSYGYHQDFRGPPQRNFGPQMYGGLQNPGDRYSRDRGRRPPHHDHRMDREHDRDEEREKERIRDRVKSIPETRGTFADPLEEFERIMREKDRRKQQQLEKAAQPPKRSRSRSFSPSTRRTPSPFLKRQRTYSRSPSPKRKRLIRRRTYSRSKSRSPGIQRRILARSRSRNRSPSLSSAPTSMPSKRRSPRRAPPFSPSPPPTRPAPRDKDEYFEKHPPPRFESNRINSRGFPREYDGKFDGPMKYESGSKYHESGSKYEGTSNYEIGAHKYEGGSKHKESSSSKFEGGPAKYEPLGSSKYEGGSSKYDSTTKYESTAQYDRKFVASGSKYDNKYDSKQESSSRYDSGQMKYERDREKKYDRSTTARGYPQHGEQSRQPDQRRGAEKDRDRDRDSRGHQYEHDQNAIPSVPELFGQPQAPISLFDLKISKPHGLDDKTTSYYNPGVSPSRAILPTPATEQERELDSVSLSLSPDSEGKAHSHRRRKSGEGKENSPTKSEKKVKKEKRKHKKKSRDEKDKKSKKKRTRTPSSPKSEEHAQHTTQTESESGGSRRNSGDTPTQNVDASTASAEDSQTGTAVAVICDSTVKSPIHLNTSSTTEPEEAVNVGLEAEPESSLDLSFEKHQETVLDPETNDNILDKADTRTPEIKSKDIPSIKSGDSSNRKASTAASEGRSPAQEVIIPASKWDRYDDEDEGPKEKKVVAIPGLMSTEIKLEEMMVTSEVIKRAENALFHRAIGSIKPKDSKLSSPKVKSEVQDMSSPDRPKELEVKREARRNNSSIQITVASAVVNDPSREVGSGGMKRSVKDRLGSKVEEPSSRERERSRGDSRSRDTSTVLKSQVSVSRSDRDKGREKERDRDRRGRSRSRSPGRFRDRDLRHDLNPRMVIQLRGSRNRSPVREFPRNRDDRARVRKSRSRSPRPRPRASPPRLKPLMRDLRRSRSPRFARRRSPSEERRRDGSGNRNRRGQERERRESPTMKSRDDTRGSTKLGEEDEKEPSPPGVSPRTMSKAEEEEKWKICSDKFVPIGIAPVTDQSYTPPPSDDKGVSLESKKASKPAPVPLSFRKAKGRINIKLSSTSKTADNDTSSSESDDDADAKSSIKIRSSIESDTEKKKRKEKREKKKAKRRKSDSTSSSSSDSEERKKRKKKKKKKSKKRKK